MRPPRIGVLLDWAVGGEGHYFSSRPYYALRQHYIDAITQSGGLALGLPYGGKALEAVLASVDGLLIPGGDYPFPVHWYHPSEPPSPYGTAPHPRCDYEQALIRAALAQQKPLLAICAGMQALAAALGGALTGDVQRYTAVPHRVAEPERPSHEVEIVPDSLLDRLLGPSAGRARVVAVNSAHREAVLAVPPSLRVSARAPDGVIEAIEVVDHPFAVGVEWHPEYGFVAGAAMAETPLHRRLFEELVAAAQR